jgi:hypothetical protein
MFGGGHGGHASAKLVQAAHHLAGGPSCDCAPSKSQRQHACVLNKEGGHRLPLENANKGPAPQRALVLEGDFVRSTERPYDRAMCSASGLHSSLAATPIFVKRASG